MGEVNVCTLSRVNDLKGFISKLMIESRKQRYIALLCVSFGLLSAILELNTFLAISMSIVMLLLGCAFLLILFISMSSAEKSLNEFHDLLMSITPNLEDQQPLSKFEVQQLQSFTRQSKRFIVLYCILKTVNWIVFLVSVATLFYEVALLIH